MSKPLPRNCSIADMEGKCAALLKDLKKGDAEAASRVRQHLPGFKYCSDEGIFEASIATVQAERVIASEYGFPDWEALTKRIKDQHRQSPVRDGGIDLR